MPLTSFKLDRMALFISGITLALALIVGAMRRHAPRTTETTVQQQALWQRAAQARAQVVPTGLLVGTAGEPLWARRRDTSQ